jgi:hypothetical protein
VTAPDITEARDLAAMWQARAEAAEAERDGARTDARGWREECDGLMSSLKTIAWDRDEARAIIAGRTTPPTDAEVEAHCATGGTWRSIVPGEWILSTHDGDPEDVAETIGVQSANAAIVARAGVRWWAVDPEGRPCAWPVVAPLVECGCAP